MRERGVNRCDKKVPKISGLSEVKEEGARVQHVFAILTPELVVLRSDSFLYETKTPHDDMGTKKPFSFK